MNEKKYKEEFRKDVCFQCPKRMPCALYNSICELVTPCVVCEIRDTCTSLCDQMEAYVQRGNVREHAIPFSRVRVPMLVSDGANGLRDGDNLICYLTEQNIKNTADKGTRGAIYSAKHIPWGAISEKAEKFIIEHFINNKTYEDIAAKYNVQRSVVYHTIHGGPKRKGALHTLNEYAILRQNFIKHRHELPKKIRKMLRLHLFKFKTQSEIAKMIGVSQVRVTQQLKTGKKMLQGLIKRRTG